MMHFKCLLAVVLTSVDNLFAWYGPIKLYPTCTIYLINLLLNTSRETPLVSGILKCTHRSCQTIIAVKNVKTDAGPTVEKSIGMNDGMIAARTQWIEAPKAWPEALRWLGNNSEINTQITVPWPIAWAQTKTNKNRAMKIPCHYLYKILSAVILLQRNRNNLWSIDFGIR